jgi:metacaspase-1
MRTAVRRQLQVRGERRAGRGHCPARAELQTAGTSHGFFRAVFLGLLVMAKRIHFSELERMLADPATSDEALAVYLKPAQLRALPLAPLLTVNETKVELPRNRGILGLTIKSLNDRANHRRLAAYKARMESGWKSVKLLAEGDSWFLYPILLKDIIDNLSADYAIYSMAAAGDTLENMVRSTAHFEALIAEHKFDGFLLSAGGNDIAGDLLRTYLNSQCALLMPCLAFRKRS